MPLHVFFCFCFFDPLFYFKRSTSSSVRPRLNRWKVGREVKWGKDLRSFSQQSSSRLGTVSQILNRDPVLLFSWMFTTPPWMYMQPAWRQQQKSKVLLTDPISWRERSNVSYEWYKLKRLCSIKNKSVTTNCNNLDILTTVQNNRCNVQVWPAGVTVSCLPSANHILTITQG